MKLFLTYFFSFITLVCLSQTKNEAYDSVLAKSLGADEYGMKKYVLVILKTGTAKITDKAKKDSLFTGHLKNIGRLADEGKLIIAGPFLEENDKTYRGIFILNVQTIEEANTLLITDPAIKEKVFTVELYPWYGSAAIPASKKTGKYNF